MFSRPQIFAFLSQRQEDNYSRFFTVFSTREYYNCKLNVLQNVWSMR